MSYERSSTPSSKRNVSQFYLFKNKSSSNSSKAILRSSQEECPESRSLSNDLSKLKINGVSDVRSPQSRSDNHDNCSNSTPLADVIGLSSNNPGQVGLNNLGNTCFMNCILQCLSNTTCLLSYCLTNRYQSELNRSSKMSGNLFLSYVDLMKKIWCNNSGSDSISPADFKQKIQRYSPRFVGYLQQDAQEFLRYVLEGLHEDVNRVKGKVPVEIPDYNKEDKLNNTVKSKLYIERYLRRDDSIIVDIFMGQLMSTLECLKCKYKSTTFDPFFDISLPIEKKDSVTIMDCIRLFTAKEDLNHDERPYCSSCKQHRRCQKSFTIQKFPKILVIHFKRFSGERLRSKLNTHVDFPLKDLDLSEFASESCSNLSTGTYDLYSISNHSGGCYGGHYTAYCHNPLSKQWLAFNDSRVSSISKSSLVSSEAYVLFYQSQSP